jgi:hypothetical protein
VIDLGIAASQSPSQSNGIRDSKETFTFGDATESFVGNNGRNASTPSTHINQLEIRMSITNENNEDNLTREFLDFVASLRGEHRDGTELGSPDGVIDRSDIAHVLRWFTRDGRAVKSDAAGALSKVLGEWMQYMFRAGSADEIMRCIEALCVMIHLILRAVQEIHSDTCPEEVLMVALDQCRLTALSDDLSATPYRLTTAGHVAADITDHLDLAKGFVINERVKHAFMRRNITPVHYEAHPQDSDTEETSTAEPESLHSLDIELLDEADLLDANPANSDSTTAGTRKVNVGDLGPLTACPLDGFDEFHDYFNATDYVWWEMGINFEDLPPFGSTIDPDDYRDW